MNSYLSYKRQLFVETLKELKNAELMTGKLETDLYGK